MLKATNQKDHDPTYTPQVGFLFLMISASRINIQKCLQNQDTVFP